MKVIGPDYIDYWQPLSVEGRGSESRFGIRVRQDRCWPLIQVGEEPASSFGCAQEIPVDLHSLPDYLQIIVNEGESDPAFDLLDVLSGRKSFQKAFKSPANAGLK